MPTNPYLDFWNDPAEQNLLQSLTTEAIQMFGTEVRYLPVTLRKEDLLYNEDTLRKFSSAVSIEMYLDNVQGWDAQGDFMSKFGLQMKDQLTMRVSRERFIELVSPISGKTRPMEGDLIYLPAPVDALMEIVHVIHERGPGQFYPLGKLTYYQVKLESYTSNQEEITTGDDEIDVVDFGENAAITLFVNNGSGTYTVGETVFQGPSLATAIATGRVSAWTVTENDNTLAVVHTNGAFVTGAPVVGVTTGASYTVITPLQVLSNPNDATEDNLYLEEDSLSVVDTRDINRISGR
jgi:hypothetical protein